MNDSKPVPAEVRGMALDALTEGRITVSEYARQVGRNVPVWLNLDAMLTPEECVDIEAITEAVQHLLHQTVLVAARVRWATHLSDRFESRVDDDWLAFQECIGTDRIDAMGGLIAALIQQDGISDVYGSRSDRAEGEIPAEVEVALRGFDADSPARAIVAEMFKPVEPVEPIRAEK